MRDYGNKQKKEDVDKETNSEASQTKLYIINVAYSYVISWRNSMRDVCGVMPWSLV
jgi:hypothetical protein